MSNMFGVKLKSTGGHRPSSRTRLAEDSNAEQKIGNQRKCLRKVNLPPKTKRRSRSTSSSRSSRRYRKPGSSRPFKLRKAPVFGVVLRPKLPALGTIHEEEEFLDLEDLQLLNDSPLPGHPDGCDGMDNSNDAAAQRPRRQKSLDDDLESSATSNTSNGSSRRRPVDDRIEEEEENKPRRRKKKGSGIVVSFFGIRLKPNSRGRRRSNQSHKNRTYQIDLNPTMENDHDHADDGSVMSATSAMNHDDEYESKSKAFLELKLRPVSKGGNMMDGDSDASSSKDSNQKFVELQLRHVVAPADGGPKRTVTEAVFQIPLLRKVAAKGDRQKWKQDNLQDLLQIAVQSLKAATPNEKDPHAPQRLQIELRHVDPETQEVQTLEHAIEVILSHPDIVDAMNASCRNGDQAPSMEVNLKNTGIAPASRWSNAADRDASPNLSKVQLKHFTTINEEEDEEDYSESFSESSGDIDLMGGSDSENNEDGRNGKIEETPPKDGSINDLGDLMLDDSEDTIDSAPNLRASMPNLAIEQSLPLSASDLQAVEEGEEEYEEDVKTDKDNAPSRPARHRSTDKVTPPPARSSSLTEMDRMRNQEEKKEASAKRKKERAEEKKAQAKLSNQKRRDLLMWYNRMRTPTRDDMKKKVMALDKSCDISPEDVDDLPWLCKGKFLDLRVMNQMFMEDWRGEATKHGDSSSSSSDSDGD